jgi:hypothetical protein
MAGVSLKSDDVNISVYHHLKMKAAAGGNRRWRNGENMASSKSAKKMWLAHGGVKSSHR